MRKQPSPIDSYISQRRSERASESTISKELVVLRAALKLALRSGIWRGVVGEIIPPGFTPEYRPRTRALSREELQLLLRELTPDHAARVAFIVATSACWSETERARSEHVDIDRGRVFIDGTKRAARRRSIPIVTEEQRSLLRYAMDYSRGENGRLFRPWGKVCRDLAQACLRAGIPRCSPNDASNMRDVAANRGALHRISSRRSWDTSTAAGWNAFMAD